MKTMMRCPKCGLERSPVYDETGMNIDNHSCPSDGWRMDYLRDTVDIHFKKDDAKIVRDAFELAAERGVLKDVEGVDWMMLCLNSAFQMFEENTKFRKPEDCGNMLIHGNLAEN